MPAPDYDALVVGGGPVGCAAAIALSDAGARVAVLEAQAHAQRAPDSRTLALSWNSHLILQRLGAWSADLSATPINTIHVSQRGHFGRAYLSAGDVHLPALGYVARFSDIHDALLAAMQARRLDYRSGFKVSAVDLAGPVCAISGTTAAENETVRARLAVIADGGASLNVSFAGRMREHDYGQVALVGLVRVDRSHQNCAYERFTAAGPIALLPCGDEFAFVWTCTPQRAAELLALGEAAFLEQLREAFGDRAGRFVAVRLRASFPLRLRLTQPPREAGVVLLGNAAQTLHPIAGQGFNLGLRDAWDLADVLRDMPAQAIGSAEMTAQFHRQRRIDRAGGIAFTHGLTRLFGTDFLPVAAARGLGLMMVDIIPPVRRELMRRMIFGVGS